MAHLHEAVHLVLEAGGTTLRAARFDPAGPRLVGRRTAPTPAPVPGETPAEHHLRVLRALARLSSPVLGDIPPVSVTVAYPGPLDELGRVLAAPTMLRHSSGEPFDLAAACARTWPGARVVIMNDLTAAGYRYIAAGLRSFAVLTVGSGIGHKVFLDGLPRVGIGRGGEIGHLRLDLGDDAPACDCGGKGHLGALASGRGTATMVRRQAALQPSVFASSWFGRHHCAPEQVDGVAVAEAFAAGDPLALQAVQAGVRHLGQALAAIHLDTGVELIILVGGFATALGEPYRRLVVAAAADACWQVGQDWNGMIRLGSPTEDAALIGAGWAVHAGFPLTSVGGGSGLDGP